MEKLGSKSYWRNRCNIIECCIDDEHSTHWTRSSLWVQKKTQKKKCQQSTFSFTSNQQTTTLEKQEQHHWAMYWNQTQHSLNSIWTVNTKETRKWHPPTIHSSIFIKSTGSSIRDTGVKSLCDSMMENTTLTKLNLDCEREKEQRKWSSLYKHSFPFLSNQQGTDLKNKNRNATNKEITMFTSFPWQAPFMSQQFQCNAFWSTLDCGWLLRVGLMWSTQALPSVHSTTVSIPFPNKSCMMVQIHK